MNDEEIRSTIEQVKAQVKAKPENAEKSEDEIDEMILEGFFDEFKDGKMSKEDLEALANAMGYELTEDFDKDEGPAEGEGAPAEGITEEEAEETKVIEPGESKEDFKDKIEEAKDEEKAAPAEDEGDDAEEEVEEEDEDIVADDDEEAQRAKASELFKMKF